MSATADAERVVERTLTLARIPAPTGRERARAEVVRAWWRDDGWSDVTIDAAGNVWACVRRGASAAVLVGAHLDTVFAADVPHEPARADGRITGPGVGDDSVAVAALSAAATLVEERTAAPVWLLATVGEEGLGNLAGVRAALDAPAQAVAGFVAVEGNYLGRVSLTGVGSVRWRVTMSGPGGHAWEAAAEPSAIHALAAAIAGLPASSAEPRTVVNVGLVGGGEAINARARHAWFDVDVRAEDPAVLLGLVDGVRAAIERASVSGIDVSVEELGRRPAGATDRDHPLARAAIAALDRAGIEPTFDASSTDANAAHERGIPAVAIGITTGGGEHTLEEWIDEAPIAVGVEALAATIAGFGGSR